MKNEIIREFEHFLGRIHPVEVNYFVSDSDKYVSDITESFLNQLRSDEDYYESLMKYFKSELDVRTTDDGSIVFDLKKPKHIEISHQEFMANCNLENVRQIFRGKCIEEVEKVEQKERELKEQRERAIQRAKENAEAKYNALKYFNEQFIKELNVFDNLDDSKEIKKHYNSVAKRVKSYHRKAFFWETSKSATTFVQLNQGLEKEIIEKYNITDKFDDSIFTTKLRNTVIHKLKEIEKFTPYKEIITSKVQVRPGYYHHANGFVYKDFVDEWDLYFKEKPEISKAINKKANFHLNGIGDFIPSEYLFLFQRPNLTSFGYDHLYDILDSLTDVVEATEHKMGESFLEKYSKKYNPANSKYVAGNWQTPEDYRFNKPYWNFHQMKQFENQIKALTRKAENLVRDKLIVPRVNEGWISETKLYNEIKVAFKGRKVIQHARLPFLGKQHLDIFIPSLKVAIEYQGLQHDQPVEFFGGEKAFLKNQERDARKKRLCTENGIRMLYVREGYDLEEVINNICKMFLKEGK
ncbi:hypothetical protein MM300_16245 [Evansella sp. LMS18]|uniref:hypothetical protein n=1 Tax=Evansella sp. LMS18 TaxID=2924033 RepID=UPI0020D149C9|nr:hypothetical protein [Evansella sp. LMS18]UTR09435.1 hypothetical protein MM300_16245 [Evansella sp. LMS18]